MPSNQRVRCRSGSFSLGVIAYSPIITPTIRPGGSSSKPSMTRRASSRTTAEATVLPLSKRFNCSRFGIRVRREKLGTTKEDDAIADTAINRKAETTRANRDLRDFAFWNLLFFLADRIIFRTLQCLLKQGERLRNLPSGIACAKEHAEAKCFSGGQHGSFVLLFDVPTCGFIRLKIDGVDFKTRERTPCLRVRDCPIRGGRAYDSA